MTTSITTLANIFEHTLDPIMGFDISPGHALLYTAKLSENVTILPYEGRVVHLNSAGEFEMGAAGGVMPMFIQKWSMPLGHQSTLSPYWQGFGNYPFSAMVATGGFEIATTEYDSAKTYAVNDYLAALASNTVQATGGLLTNKDIDGTTALTPPWKSGGTTRTVVGQVSRVPQQLRNKNTVICLWTLNFPGAT